MGPGSARQAAAKMRPACRRSPSRWTGRHSAGSLRASPSSPVSRAPRRVSSLARDSGSPEGIRVANAPGQPRRTPPGEKTQAPVADTLAIASASGGRPWEVRRGSIDSPSMKSRNPSCRCCAGEPICARCAARASACISNGCHTQQGQAKNRQPTAGAFRSVQARWQKCRQRKGTRRQPPADVFR